MGREEQVRDAKCTRPSLPVEGLAPRLPQPQEPKQLPPVSNGTKSGINS